jgi:phosphatidylserine synthase
MRYLISQVVNRYRNLAIVHLVPNILSATRYVLAIPMGLFVWHSMWTPAAIALWVAIATDVVDGRLARYLNVQSSVGGLLDHSSDAVFVSVTLFSLASLGLVPLALPICVALAFLQYMLDSKSLSGMPLRTSALGRYNGICYFILAGFPIMQHSLQIFIVEEGLFGLFGWGLVISSVLSMVDRASTLLYRIDK